MLNATDAEVEVVTAIAKKIHAEGRRENQRLIAISDHHY